MKTSRCVRVGSLYALDNRCPHMGFPLDRGTVQDGVLTCHWHHARFDLASGGTFDLWADDVRSFPVRVEGDEVWVDLSPRGDEQARQLQRLQDGLRRNIRLVIGKSVIALLHAPTPRAQGQTYQIAYRLHRGDRIYEET